MQFKITDIIISNAKSYSNDSTYYKMAWHYDSKKTSHIFLF